MKKFQLSIIALSTFFLTTSFNEAISREYNYLQRPSHERGKEVPLNPSLDMYEVPNANPITHEVDILTRPLGRFLYMYNEDQMPTRDMLVYTSGIDSNNMICRKITEDYFMCLSDRGNFGSVKNALALVRVKYPQFAILTYSINRKNICNSQVYSTIFSENDYGILATGAKFEKVKHLTNFDYQAKVYKTIFGCDTTKGVNYQYVNDICEGNEDQRGTGCLIGHGRMEMPWRKMYSRRLGDFE